MSHRSDPSEQFPASLVTVFCLDDNPDIAEMLRVLIDRQPDMRCVGFALDVETFLSEVESMRPRPRVAVVDLTLSTFAGEPLSAIRRLAELCPECRAIVYSGYDARDVGAAAKDAGAWGYVSKHLEPDRLLDAIRRVSKGDIAFAE